MYFMYLPALAPVYPDGSILSLHLSAICYISPSFLFSAVCPSFHESALHCISRPFLASVLPSVHPSVFPFISRGESEKVLLYLYTLKLFSLSLLEKSAVPFTSPHCLSSDRPWMLAGYIAACLIDSMGIFHTVSMLAGYITTCLNVSLLYFILSKC